MCLAVPGKIIEIFDQNGLKMAKVDFGGVIRETCLEALPEAQIGQYAIVHAGFALNLLSEEEAQATLEILNEMSQLEDEFPQPDAGSAD